MAVLEALEQATGADYQATKVNTTAGDHRTPGYLAEVHPLGTVPALITNGGIRMIESAAITLYLGDLVPDDILAPPATNEARGRYLDWMVYGTTSIYTVYMRLYQTEQHTPDGVEQGRLAEFAGTMIRDRWSVVEQALTATAHPWLVRETVTAADLYLAMLALWYPDQEEFRQSWPRTAALKEAAFQIPCMARAHAIHLAG
jgi:glutathione S-transferase